MLLTYSFKEEYKVFMEAVLIAVLTFSNIFTLIFFKGREEKMKDRFNSYLSKLDLENLKLKKLLRKKSKKRKPPTL